MRFPFTRATVLEFTSSDHLPIFLKVRYMVPRKQAHRFWFANSWIREQGCRDLITDYWLSSMGVDLVLRLYGYGDILSIWGKELQQLHKAEMDQCLATMGNLRGSRAAGDILSFLAAKN